MDMTWKWWLSATSLCVTPSRLIEAGTSMRRWLVPTTATKLLHFAGYAHVLVYSFVNSIWLAKSSDTCARTDSAQRRPKREQKPTQHDKRGARRG